MNRLIIIGNGFDLSLGLKTSYNDFLVYYLKKVTKNLESPELYDRIKFIKDVGNVREYSNPLLNLKLLQSYSLKGIIENIENMDSYQRIYDYLNEYGILNYEFILLKEIHKRSISNNWVDFEIMYYDTLINFYKGIKNDDDKEEKLRDFHNKFELFKNEFIEYLGNLDFDYNTVKVTEFYSNTSEYFLEKGYDKTPIRKLHLLSFNYTKSVKEFQRFLRGINYEINYIHGDLKDKDSVIFGFGDELDDDYKTIETERSQELFKNIKSVHYFNYPNYKKLYFFISQEPYEVFIYGHSCGVSDRTLLNEILEHKNCKHVRIFYYKKGDWDNHQDISMGLIRQFTDKTRMRHIVRTKGKNDTMFQLNPR